MKNSLLPYIVILVTGVAAFIFAFWYDYHNRRNGDKSE